VKFSVDVNIAENLNRLSRAHERYRQTDDRQTDGRAIAYSEREREFTFAKNLNDFFKTKTDVAAIPCQH